MQMNRTSRREAGKYLKSVMAKQYLRSKKKMFTQIDQCSLNFPRGISSQRIRDKSSPASCFLSGFFECLPIHIFSFYALFLSVVINCHRKLQYGRYSMVLTAAAFDLWFGDFFSPFFAPLMWPFRFLLMHLRYEVIS